MPPFSPAEKDFDFFLPKGRHLEPLLVEDGTSSCSSAVCDPGGVGKEGVTARLRVDASIGGGGLGELVGPVRGGEM
jgi:hypothetical protein